MTESTDLREDDNRLFSIFRQFNRESITIVISSVAAIAALLACLMSLMAWNDAKEARILIETKLELQQRQIDEYQRKVEIYDVRYANWVAYMRANGVELPE